MPQMHQQTTRHSRSHFARLFHAFPIFGVHLPLSFQRQGSGTRLRSLCGYCNLLECIASVMFSSIRRDDISIPELFAMPSTSSLKFKVRPVALRSVVVCPATQPSDIWRADGWGTILASLIVRIDLRIPFPRSTLRSAKRASKLTQQYDQPCQPLRAIPLHSSPRPLQALLRR